MPKDNYTLDFINVEDIAEDYEKSFEINYCESSDFQLLQHMSKIFSNNKRIAKNTIVLYLRMMVIMVINLYISRAVLKTLGINDYGIYNVVGGFVTMFSLLSGSLSNAISRYITFELGRGDIDKLKKVFSTSVTVQILLSIGIGVILEIVGIWFLNNKMQIPLDRLHAANWTLQCSIITFILNLISVPYNGCIIAHEKMTAFAYISTSEVILKFGSVLFLYLNITDNLITYSVLLMLTAAIIRLIYGIYCKRNFEECNYRFIIDKALIMDMTKLASWNFLGAGGGVLNDQGVNVLLNLFFGVALNAARGISVQVNGAIQQFTNSFITAINPQITKNYACGNYEDMRKLLFSGCRFSYYLMLILTLPIIIETPTILELWLVNVPDATVLFVRLTLIISLIATLSNLFFTVAMATGDIKNYQLIVGSLSLSCFFFTYIGYKLGASPSFTYYVSLAINVIILFARLFIVNNLIYIGIKDFCKQVLFKVVVVTTVSTVIVFFAKNIMPEGLLWALASISFSISVAIVCITLFGLSKSEKTMILDKIKNIQHRNNK